MVPELWPLELKSRGARLFKQARFFQHCTVVRFDLGQVLQMMFLISDQGQMLACSQ